MENKFNRRNVFILITTFIILAYLFLVNTLNATSDKKAPTLANVTTPTQPSRKLDSSPQSLPSIPQKTVSSTTITRQASADQATPDIPQKQESRHVESLFYELSEKQKENLANEIEITKRGWLIYPYSDKDVEGNPNPILKYVPHLDNQGNFHSVSIFDVDISSGDQLAYAYPIPYTSDFPPVSLEKAEKLFLNKWNNDRYIIENANKLVWLSGDRYTPFRLYICKTKQKEKIYLKDGKEIKVLFPRKVTTSHCLLNAYNGNIEWGKTLETS